MHEIMTYNQMCQREGSRLQKGMVYRPGKNKSLLLMSLRKNAPYFDSFEEDGQTLIYRGHDAPKSPQADQPFARKSLGSLTANGRFYLAAMSYLRGIAKPLQVKIYQKLMPGVWSFNGEFALIDAWEEYEEMRRVFCFKLKSTSKAKSKRSKNSNRTIPSWVKAQVYKRDGGRCVICGCAHNLHFDHIIPYSKGGSSMDPKNIQLLCALHNLRKRDRVM